MQKAGELYIEVDLRGDAARELHDYNLKLRDAVTWGGKFVGSVNEMDANMLEYARSIGLTDERLKDLIEQRNLAAKLGVDVNALQRFRQASEGASEAQSGLSKAMGALAGMGIGAIVTRWGSHMMQMQTEAEGAWAGLSAVVRSQFGEGAVEPAIQQIKQVRDNLRGIVADADLADAAKQLTSMGYSAEQAAHLLEANAKAHMVAGNQTYSTAEALKVYAKALKDGNSAVIDVTGNSANLDQIMKSLGFQMQDLSDPVKGTAARQAYLNYQMQWASVYFSEAERAMAGFKGEMGAANSKIGDMMRFGGELLIQVITPLLRNGINPLLTALGRGVEWLQKTEWAMNLLKLAVMILIPLLGTFLTAAIWSSVSGMIALNAKTKETLITWSYVIGFFLGLFLILEDFYTWMNGGKSLIGEWLGPWEQVGWVIKTLVVGAVVALMVAFGVFFGWIPVAIAAVVWLVYDLWNAFNGGPSLLRRIWESITGIFVAGGKWLLNFGTTYGKYVIMALFPLSAVYFYWDEIMAALPVLGQGAVDLLSRYGKYIIMALFPISALWFYRDEIIDFFTGLPDRILEALASAGPKLRAFFTEHLGGLLNFIGGNTELPAPPGPIERRAYGGPVEAGQPVIVGDGGRPELFVPDRSGTILPSVPASMPAPISGRSGGGGINFVVNVNVNGGASRDTAENIASRVKDVLAAMVPEIRMALGAEEADAL